MSAPARRAAMRVLSPRAYQLQGKTNVLHSQFRCASSRYSNPAQRTTTQATTAAPSFLPSATQPQDAPEVTPFDPLAARAAYLAQEDKRQHAFRKMRFAGMGLLLSFMGLIVVISGLDLDQLEQSAEVKQRKGQQMDASSEANSKFQGKEIHIIGAGEGKRIVAQGSNEEIELVETGTSSVPHFPRTINLPTNTDQTGSSVSNTSQLSTGVAGVASDSEEYTLVGLGIRSVSFLSIQVYVVGMYIRTADISTLQSKLIHAINESASTLIPSEKEKLRAELLDPSRSREIWNELLQVPGLKTAWRIAPTRNTDFGHLRDGWITGINNRTREARAAVKGAETEYDAEDFGKAIGDFKAIFTGGKAPKGSVMLLSRGTSGDLTVWFQPKPDTADKAKAVQNIGSVADERISRLIWLGYLGGEKVSSEAARQGVVDGCVGFAARPIGSVETMVT